jgi:alpha-glucosidase
MRRAWVFLVNCVVATLVLSGGVMRPSSAPLAAQSLPGDADGDGVPDGADCAPADARISEPHTYFYDADGDQFGDPARSLALCLTVPPPGLVAWGNDPDDTKNTAIPAPVAKGARTLGIDFNDPPQNAAWRPDLAEELGADAASMSVQWSGIETSAGAYNGPQAAALQAVAPAYASHQFGLNLTISPFQQSYWTLPADLGGIQTGARRLSDPDVIARFNALLDFVHTQLGAVPLAGLQIGHEVDLFLPVRSDVPFWSDFLTFFQAAQAHAKALWGNQLRVGVTSTSAGLLQEPAASLMQALNGVTDVVSLTYFPRTPAFHVADPTQVKGDIQRVIARYYPKPLSFQSVGYPSASRVGSSETRQSQFMQAFFDTWDAYPTLITYASLGRLHDVSASAAAGQAQAPHLAVPPEKLADATAYFGSLGLRTFAGAGAAKSGYQTLRSDTLNRGWWHVPATSSRSYLLGFIPALWQQTPEGPIQDDVLAYNANIIGHTSDLIAYHFDQGIPWPEAYADTFSSPDPPYSNNVRTVWNQYRSTTPPGARVAVAITPLGLPRTRMAAYWGVGQGFILDNNFNQVPNGPVIDYEGRILPAPWNTYALDSTQVKTAFLNYARRVIDYFHPAYLITGIEANLAVADPVVFAQYLELQKYVYTQLRSNHAYDNVKIVVSLTAEQYVNDELGRPALLDALMDSTLQQRNLDALRQLAPFLDVVGLSLYPIKTLYGTNTIPAWFIDNLVDAIRGVTDKPIGITETGYPAVSFNVLSLYFPSDAEKQARYLRLLFSDLQKRGNVEFLIHWSVRDLTAALDQLRARIAATPGMNQSVADFYHYFEFDGLYDAAGTRRPSADVFQQFFNEPLSNPQQFVPSMGLWSPSGTVQAQVGVNAAGHLVYSVTRGSTRVLDDSTLGLIVDGVDLGTNITSLSARPVVEGNETYPTRGVHPRAVNHYLETTFDVRRAGQGDMTYSLVVRVYDDGVAYRYVMPGTGPRVVSGESSAWAFPYQSAFWYQTNTGNYESMYWKGTIGFVDDHIGGPFTVVLPNNGGFALLTESALLNYSGLSFRSQFLSPVISSEFLDDTSWTVAGGGVSPWRTLLVAATLNDLVNSDLVLNLNQAPDPALFPEGMRTRWIQPGRSVWSWWSDQSSPADFDTQRRYVDDATRLRAEYVLVDAGWEQGFPAAGKDQFQRLADLVAYAHTQQRYVDVWVWKHWNELGDATARRAFFKSVHDAGAVGVKIDDIAAFDSESFASVQRYEAILRDAAAARLMINFHGCNKATGLERTYPNQITREGMAGMESNLHWAQGETLPASHNAAAPFIRMATGVADYTPVSFDARKIGGTTFTHQLATSVLFTSPVQHFADDPAILLAQPLVQDVLRLLPTEWDETIVLPQSAIGEAAVMARRKRNRWYVAAINGSATDSRTLAGLSLSFLGDGQYDAIVIGDNTATSFARDDRHGLRRTDTVDASMLPGGGFVAVFSPAADYARRVPAGFNSLPPSFTSQGWQQAYAALVGHADIVSHTQQDAVPWVQALTSANYRDYSAYLQSFWDLFVAADSAVVPGMPRYLMLNPIDPSSYTGLAPQWDNQITFTLPAPWNGYNFDNPNVKTAFVNYVTAAIEAMHPTYVALNVEANILLAKAPDKWAAFKDFNAYVYSAIKQRYPNVIVFSTIQYEHMLGLTEESRALKIALRDTYADVLESEVKALLQYSDLVAISTYPFIIENNRYARPDGSLDPDYYARAYAIADELKKPIAFEQTGYISKDLYVASRNVTLPGSDVRQRQFVTQLLHDSHVENVSFLINFIADDYGTAYGTSGPSMTWAYTGLWREDGTPKPALADWDAVRAAGNATVAAGSTSTAPSAPTFATLAVAIANAPKTASVAPLWTVALPPPPELFVRWQQFVSLLPGFVPPEGEDATAPFAFNDPFQAAARATLARRQLFLPYLQPMFDAFAQTGVFALRAMPSTGAPLFLIGDWVLVAPVVEDGAVSRLVDLPAGAQWQDFYTGQLWPGGQTIAADAPLDRMPIFIRVPDAPR